MATRKYASAPVTRGTKVTKAYKGKTVIKQGPAPNTGRANKNRKKQVSEGAFGGATLRRRPPKGGPRPLKRMYK